MSHHGTSFKKHSLTRIVVIFSIAVGLASLAARATAQTDATDAHNLIRQLGSADATERAAAALRLRQAPVKDRKRAVPALLRLLDDWSIVSVPSEDFPDTNPPGVQAARTIASIGRDGVRQMIRAFPRLEITGRLNVIRTIGPMDDPDTARFVSTVMRDLTRDFELRLAAAVGRAGTGDRNAAPILLEALTHNQFEQREAAQALASFHDAADVEPLIRSIERDPVTVWGGTVGALSSFKDRRAVPVLLDVLSQARDADSRREAASGLYGLADRAYPQMLAALRDRDWTVVERAVAALGTTRDRAAIPELLKALQAADDQLMSYVIARTLMSFGDEGAAALEQFLASSDMDPRVRQTVETELRRFKR